MLSFMFKMSYCLYACFFLIKENAAVMPLDVFAKHHLHCM